VAYTDLCTFSELMQADDSRAVVSDLPSLRSEALAVIADVTDLVDAALGLGASGRGTIVRERIQAIEGHEWSYSDVVEDYLAWADQRPVVEVNLHADDDLDDVTIPRHTSRKLEIGSSDAGTVRYFGGYTRPNQALADLPTGGGDDLDGLSTEPPDMPRQIRTVAINLSLHVLQNRAEGNLGRRVQQTFGQQQVTVEGADPQYTRRQLRRLRGATNRHLVL